MPNGNKIYAFLTTRKKIYAQWEQNICFFDNQEKNICPMGKKYMIFLHPRKKYIPSGNKIYDKQEKNLLILTYFSMN